MQENTYAITTARDIYESVASNAITIFLVNIAENKSDFESLRVYPNPVKADFRLSFESGQAENMRLELTDQSGRILYSDNIRTKAGKNLLDLNREKLQIADYSGLIILKLTGINQQFTARIILE